MVVESKTRLVDPDITVVEISGRLSLGNALAALESSIKRLIDGGVRKMVVDLTALESIDSSGIGMLIGCYGHMEQRDGRLRVAGAQGSVAKVFKVVHMDRITPLDPDVDTACRALTAE
jgi:anti-sigma B factor antagonist